MTSIFFSSPNLNLSADVCMQGPLLKHSAIRRDKERYFRLRLLQNMALLEKFKDSKDPVVRDQYEIHADSEVKFSERTGAFWFMLKTKGKDHRFGAQTPFERVHWIQAIEKCMRELKSRAKDQNEKEGDGSDSRPDSENKDEKKKDSSIKIEVDSLTQELRGKRGIRKKTHYFGYQNIKSSFKGLELVAWLLKNRFSLHRKHALEVGSQLLKAGKLARVDGMRDFDGENELYVFNKAVGVTTSALIRDIDNLTEKLQALSLEVYQLENSSEELYDMLQGQISNLKNESVKMRQHIDLLTGIAVSISWGTGIMGICGNLTEVSFHMRVFLLLLILGVTIMGLLILNTNIVKDSILTKNLKFPLAIGRSSRGGKHSVIASGSVTTSASITPTTTTLRPGASPGAYGDTATMDAKFAKNKSRVVPSSNEGQSPRSARAGTTSSLSPKKSPRRRGSTGSASAGVNLVKTRDNVYTTTATATATATAEKRTIPNDPEWKRRGEGIIYRHFTTEESKDCWSMPGASEFKVRGAKYLVDGIKVVSKDYRFEVACCEMCGVEEKIDHIASYKHSALNRLRRENKYHAKSHPFPVNYLIIQFQLPGISFTMYMQARKGQNPDEEVCPGFSNLMNEFIDGSDDFRNSRFKILPTVREGGWMVKKMVGAKPALLGRKISCCYNRGEDYLEIDVDIATSYVAQKILGVVQGYCKSLIVDLGFLIEGREEKELPEVMLGAVRFHNVDLAQIPKLDLGPSPLISEAASPLAASDNIAPK
eukprot:CAMPEP_0184493522 /NCGR_PEP_ID=MMETSP0113_2-20130426/26207_1 /TAXON_ID=91329 /ORGANISM="Norrisiella sphaerica, Strain BC52" /LENGTH=764 /DNA_ID=CAMNT_0026878813 /DNA_START=332 /DNA_END=2626 /DNA_ORIENTATION=+